MPACIICDHPTLTPHAAFGDLPRVTSDARIWRSGGRIVQCAQCGMVQKPIDTEFLADADTIYASYQLYEQAAGHEQKIFSGGTARPRSEIVIDQIAKAFSGKTGRLLDVGCGAGNLLQAASRHLPGWALYGADINDRKRKHILAIPGVRRFFHGDIATVEETFDVICISHVLEHVPNPLAFLIQLRARLKPHGLLAVLVPNWVENYFDLLVADHCAHFTLETLRFLLQRGGYAVPEASDRLLPKELFMLAKPQDPTQNKSFPIGKGPAVQLEHALEWLRSTRDWAMDMKNRGTAYGVFGTAIAATWLVHAAKLAPECFVDEDTDRQDHLFMGRPVKSPASVADNMPLLVPLPPPIASAVAQRLNAGRPRATFIAPPV